MNQFKIKYKMLCYGFPPIEGSFISDNFELKDYKLGSNLYDSKNEYGGFNPSLYLYNCCYQVKGDDSIYYNCFESIEDLIVNVPIKFKDKYEIQNYIMNKTEIVTISNIFEKKLRLVFNVRIVFPIRIIKIYDMAGKSYGTITLTKDFPGVNWQYTSNKQIFEFNSHFKTSLKEFIDLEKKNVKFERAMNYFNSSFDSSSVSTRYTMLFSALEALLIRGKTQVTEKLALRTSHILKCIDPNIEKETYSEIKKMYDIRSKYIHGSKKNAIMIRDEEKLRKYVREVLIIYWMYAQNNKLTANQIINNLDNDKRIDYLTSSSAKYMRTLDFHKAYSNVCEEISQGIMNGELVVTEMENGIVKSVMELK